MSAQRWGKRLDRWHDERGPLHLLAEDNAPRCGTRYFAMGGALAPHEGAPKCKRCEKIAAKEAKP